MYFDKTNPFFVLKSFPVFPPFFLNNFKFHVPLCADIYYIKY